MELTNENIIKMVSGKKKFFLVSFLVSLALFIISAAIIMFGYETWVEMAQKCYGLDEQHYSLVLALLMGAWKIGIIQLTLVPFIALYIAERSLKAKELAKD